jgi:hypothetical protein
MQLRQQLVFVCVLLGAVGGTCKMARADSIQTITGCCLGTSSGTLSFTSPDNGLPSTITWSGMGHVNGPTDIGASMSASYTNFASGSQGDSYNYFAELATFTDIVTITGSAAPVFNFTISGNSITSNIDYADWFLDLSLSPCSNTVCGGGSPVSAGGQANPVNGNFSLDPSNDFFGSGQYQLYVQLQARECLWGCVGPAPVAGTDLSGTADYNDTLRLDSVTLAPGETMIGQSGTDYSNLNTSTVPEPSSIVLLFTGFAGLVGATRRLRRSLEERDFRDSQARS